MIGLIVGGLLPAIFFGVSAIFVKTSNQFGIGIGPYLIALGFGVVVVGFLFFLFSPDRTFSVQSGSHAFYVGLIWGIGAGLLALGVARFNAPLGKLVPLYNMNTLISVLLALWIFAEWKQIKVPQLLIGSVLIVIGGTLVTRA